MFVAGEKKPYLDGIPVVLFTEVTRPVSKKSGRVS